MKIFETQLFEVYVGESTHPELPAERKRCYFIRHKEHGVVHLQTHLLGEALMMAVALDKGTQAVLDDPSNPDLDKVLGGMGGPLRGGLN